MSVSRFYEAFPYSLPMQQGFSQCLRLLEPNQEASTVWSPIDTSIPKSYMSLIIL
ncbi:hypothetical protein ACE6H2_008571 [Prunus campanulata]